MSADSLSHARPMRQGLYDTTNEHDNCGLGFIAHIKGRKSHAIIRQGLQILKNLTHRGATGADPLQGDGAGILLQLPDAFLRRVCGRQGITLPAVGQYGAGMVFLPKEPASRMACEEEIKRAVAGEGQVLLGWRDVPTDNSGLSERTKEVEPVIRQVFIARGSNDMDQDALERKLYIIRKRSSSDMEGSSTFPPCPREPSSTRECCSRIRSASITSTSRTRRWSPRWRWCTSASRRILSQPGISR